MEAEPGEYQKLQIHQYPPRNLKETAEGKFWDKFKGQTTQMIGAVSSIDFCQIKPHNFAVTNSTRVTIYNGSTGKVERVVSRFQERCYNGSFRNDGKLIVAGQEDGYVKVLDSNSRYLLREFKEHQKAVHATKFSPDRLQVLSGSDDATIRQGDLQTGEQVARFDGHSDYVRSLSFSPSSTNLFVTGGYDHKCLMWDLREKKHVMEITHNYPVESVNFFPQGSMLLFSGGPVVQIYDVIGGKKVHKLENNQKTVMQAEVVERAGPQSRSSPRILTGSLDGHLKIYDVDQFKVMYMYNYPQPILSFGLSQDLKYLAVGMSNGDLSIRQNKGLFKSLEYVSDIGESDDEGDVFHQLHKNATKKRTQLTAKSARYFFRGQNEKAKWSDYVVDAQPKSKIKDYDRMLRKFQFKEALDSSLRYEDIQSQRPEVVVSMLQELQLTGNLEGAIAKRNSKQLFPVLQFIHKYIADPRYTNILVTTSHIIIDIYAPVFGESLLVDNMIKKLANSLQSEIQVDKALLQLQGQVQTMLSRNEKFQNSKYIEDSDSGISTQDIQ